MAVEEARRQTLAAIAVTAVAAFFTTIFFLRFKPAFQLAGETVPAVAAAILVVFACIAAGEGARLLSVRIMGADPRRPADLPVGELFLIGFAVFGIVIAVVATIGVAIVGAISVVTVAAAIAGAWIAGRHVRTRWMDPPTVGSLLLVLPVVVAAIEAITPVNSPDELIYKLAIPHAYLLYGRALELPLASHSYLVLSQQFTDLAALVIGGGIAAKIVHFAAFLATLALIRRMAGDIAAAVVAWTPALMIISGWAWSEWGLLGLLLLSLDRYERWRGNDHPEGPPTEDIALSALALGAAATCKYTALPWLAVFAVLVVVRHRRALPMLGRAAAVVALFGSFFYVRNLIWTGSPVAPLLLPGAPHISNYRGGGLFGGWLDLLRGTDIFDMRVSDESLGVLLPVAFIIGLFMVRHPDRKVRDLSVIGIIQMVILLSFAPGSRNMINGVVPLAIAGCIGVAAWQRNAIANAALACVAALALAGQLALVAFTLQSYDWGPYLGGAETAAVYIARSRQFSAPYAWIARSTPPSARILLLAENRTFYLDRRSIAQTNHDGPRFASWLSGFTTPDSFIADLHRRGVTHILIHKPWYRVGNRAPGVLEQEYVLQVAPSTHQMLLRTLSTRCRQRYSDREYVIYQVMP